MKTLLAVTLALFATTASAASYFIERIDVNANKRISPAIVRAQARLDDGKTYDTEEIAQAVYRVRRLPFVLSADYDLLPGGKADARVLRINIEEVSSFNYDVDVNGVAHGSSRGTFAHGDVGYRFFPGTRSTLDATVGESNESFTNSNARVAALRYNAYGLFGTRAYAGIGVSTDFHGGSGHEVNPSLLLGIPLTRTQTVEGTFARQGTHSQRAFLGEAEPVEKSVRITDVALNWLWQTADDPFFARKGLDVAAGPSWQRAHFHIPFFLTAPPAHVVVSDQRTRVVALGATAIRFWPLRESSAAWGRLSASTSRSSGTFNDVALTDSRVVVGDVLAGLAHNFDHDLGRSGMSRQRVELGIGYHYDRTTSGPRRTSLHGYEYDVGYAFRYRYGLIHITGSYVPH
jgi:hypothetical protein